MSDPQSPPPPLPGTKARLPFDENPFGGAAKRGGMLLYAALTVACIGGAVYMAQSGHALTSPYVAAPGIGALWFGLRTFMVLSARK